MAYYLSKYIGTYRLKAHVDKSTGDFPRDTDGNLEQNDVYIKCKKGQIYHFGKSILVCYCDKLGAGRNVLKALGKKLGINIENYTYTKEKKDGSLYLDKDGNTMKFYDYSNYYEALENTKIIWNIIETDEEVEFKFKDKDIELIAEFMMPQTSGAKTSPFSTVNLPKTKYVIPKEDLEDYNKIKEFFIPLKLTKINDSFLKKYIGKDYKKDIKLNRMSGKTKEYIHSKNLWGKYINYLKMECKK